MAYVNTLISLLPDYLIKSSEGFTPLGLDKFTINGTSKYTSSLFVAPKSGNIVQLGVPIMGVSNTPPTLTIGIERVADGRVPNGTPIGYSGFVPTSGYNWVTIPSTAVIAGTGYSVVVRDISTYGYPGTAADATHDVSIGWKYAAMYTNTGGFLTPCSANSSVASAVDLPTHAYKYDDGSTAIGFAPIIAADIYTNTSFSSSSNPARRGNAFSVDYKCKCGGAYVCVYQINSASSVNIYLSDNNNNILRTVFYNAYHAFGLQDGKMLVEWPEVELDPNKIYRIIIQPTNTNGIYDRKLTFTQSSDRLICTRGSNIYRTTGDGTTWTDVDTELSLISPLITQIYGNGRRGLNNV